MTCFTSKFLERMSEINGYFSNQLFMNPQPVVLNDLLPGAPTNLDGMAAPLDNRNYVLLDLAEKALASVETFTQN